MNSSGKHLLWVILCLSLIKINDSKTNNKASSIEEVNDMKEFKKILRTKTNVLSLFVSNQKRAAPITKAFKDAADIIKGQGTMLYVDCNGEGKKLCKKMKVSSDSYLLRHFKDGEFNKDYTRKETVQSLVNFMKDPTGDLPWEEEPAAVNITHIANPQGLQKLLMKEQRPVMVMFYAPWCGFCKKMKPDYAAAATELKDYAVLAAIDVNRPENAAVRAAHNITGFPTLLYFRNGELKYTYEGDNNKEKLIEFMKNPEKRSVKEVEDDDWFESSSVVMLNSEGFDNFIQETPSVLVMFYAPWCGHCKNLKPEYVKAAALLKESKVKGSLAAIDATKETQLASRFNVNGYPSLKYFKNGSYAFDVSVRTADTIVKFMSNPNKNYAVPEVKKETPWPEENTEVVHLTVENIKPELRKKRHALVMFYAPYLATDSCEHVEEMTVL